VIQGLESVRGVSHLSLLGSAPRPLGRSYALKREVGGASYCGSGPRSSGPSVDTSTELA